MTIEGPVDRATYPLGPGDRLAITLSGGVQRTEETVVSADGTVVIPPVIGLRVAGLTVEAAQDALREAFRPYFRGVDVQINLVEVRRFEVYVLGLVEAPGTYVAHGATRVSSVIDQAGGVLSNGSLRAIRIERGDSSVTHVDLLAFLILGIRDSNPFLRDGDRIVVPIAGEKAAVSGAVGRPGDFEVLSGETVAQLVAIAGGTRPGADRARIEVRRFVGDSSPQTDAIAIDLDGPGGASPAQPGDQIQVYAIPEWHVRRRVDVNGEVVFPGTYVIDEGQETLRDVIERAGGFTPDASIHEATLTRSIGAESVDPEYERLKQIEVADMTRDEYEYFKLKSREKRGRVVVDFEGLFLEDRASENIVLRRGDVVDIPTATRSIKVVGQVAAPGAVSYEDGKSVKWYIERAGGYGWRASKGKTRVIRARTGEWVSAKQAKNLEAGDTIWVPEKPERDYWSIFKEGLAITSQVLTVYLVIDRISE